MENAILSEVQLNVINEKFQLDLKYSDASHYRAATIIHSLWKPKARDQEDLTEADNQSSDQDPGDTA